ncbi:MAG: MOSC N-terminal beta barrel domain-containing protein [Acidobacteriia bacterium]|nr:MOSC N-terminal beta barrel domain-containing protein [Terriglobia bacterium]
MAVLALIRLHPIKSFDPAAVSEARIGPNGGLELDRVWALHSPDGRLITGKRTPAVHFIRAAYAPDLSAVTLSVPHDRRALPSATFAFPGDTHGAADWFSRYFELPVTVRYAREGFPDDGLASGPTIVSTASLEAVCSWFPEQLLDGALPRLDQARRRFRATLELAGVPAFWEDQLFTAEENYPRRFRIGEVCFEGTNPCARCPVPPRDPETAEELPAFQKQFSALRQKTLPSWSPAARFDHFYRLATNTRVPGTESGKLLRIGDTVELF